LPNWEIPIDGAGLFQLFGYIGDEASRENAMPM